MDASIQSRTSKGRESNSLTLTPGQFARVQRLAYDRFGLSIPGHKLTMINNRLSKLRRQQRFANIEELIAHYETTTQPEELLTLFDCLSTNLTMFYREAEHYEVLRKHALEPLANCPPGSRQPLRYWSAGCSKGCEPYTLSMVLRDTLRDLEGWDARILATDLAVSELRVARSGVYPEKFVEGLDPQIVARHFTRGTQKGTPCVRVRPEVAAPVTFALLNLVKPWKLRGPFDAIFCRNVMIYFDEPTRLQLVNRFKALVRPGGFLFLGSSEGLPGEHEDLLRVAPSAFRKQ